MEGCLKVTIMCILEFKTFLIERRENAVDLSYLNCVNCASQDSLSDWDRVLC